MRDSGASLRAAALIAAALIAAAPSAFGLFPGRESLAEMRTAVSGRRGQPTLLVVAGIGGSPNHRKRFSRWARELCEAAVSGPAPFSVQLLLEREAEPAETGQATGACVPTGRSTREEIRRQIAAAGAGIDPGEPLLLVLIGHGSGGADARFQLPGPDLAPGDLAEMLNGISEGEVTVAHLGSASGAFVPALSAPGRVLLTASRAHETNETRFAKHFIAAFSGAGADRNKDGRLSALEAFDFARRGVEQEYEQAGLLRSEHPLLDDNGDGVGSLDPEASPGSDGMLAARRELMLRTAAAAEAAAEAGDPEIAALIAERDELAARVDALREVRESMEEARYLEELEALLYRIAEITERIEAARKEKG